jgi:lipopolysaccharide transport system ATP-binding protein
MAKPIIEIQSIGKRYRIGAAKEQYLSLREEVANWLSPAARRARAGAEEFWALKDVSFSVERSEAVGIIGRNGAGKSTLLKILSQITPPTEGKITCRGRIGSLLEVGTGFHAELTGRENVYMNGAILGMSRREVTRKFDEIVAFAEMEKFLDTPVKRYSSGMYVRLAFAVAAHLEPEILIVDEVLAVGDAQFQAKCLGKMGEVAKQGRTVLFVSHAMAAVEALCARAVILDHGKISFTGSAEDAISLYGANQRPQLTADVDTSSHPSRTPKASPVIRRITVCSVDDAPRSTFSVGEPILFRIVLKSTRNLPRVTVGLHIHNVASHRVVTFHTRDQMARTLDVDGGVQLSCLWDECNLMPGEYTLVVALETSDGQQDRIEPALSFIVNEADFFGTGRTPPTTDGFFLPHCRWQVRKTETPDPETIGGLRL